MATNDAIAMRSTKMVGATDAVMPDTSTTSPSLQTMPPEIIDMILGCLVPQIPHIGETKPVAYNQLMADEPWYDYTRSRRGLRSLCRVSRQLSQAARPSLYRNVALWDETAMLLFFRTICNQPHYGLWTRDLSCHITLTSSSVVRETRELLSKHLPTFEPAQGDGVLPTAARHFLRMLGRFLPQKIAMEGDYDHVPQALLSFILMFLIKVETVLLQVPISDDQEEYYAFCAQIQGIKDLFRDEPLAAPFQNIRTLRLQGDPELLAQIEDDECECDTPEVWGAQPRKYRSLFASFPQLTTLEVSSDEGVWHIPHNDPDSLIQGSGFPLPLLNNIRHVYLHDSLAYPGDLHYLLRNAPQLETLYMTPRGGGDSLFREPMDDGSGNHIAHPEALDIALAEHAKNLRNLDVSWEDITGFETLVGPDGRLTSLAEMNSLQVLCIQMALLCGGPLKLLETPLVELLPPNLVELALEDWWWSNVALLNVMPGWGTEDKVMHYQSQHHYRVNALRTLMQFARDVRTRLHRLKKVVLLCKIPWTWILEGAVPLEFHFEDVKNLFMAQGVEFSVVKSDEA